MYIKRVLKLLLSEPMAVVG